MAEHSAEIGGVPIVWRDAEGPLGPDGAPTLYVHGVPTSSAEWKPFLQRAGGIAPDLPGFGASAKRGDLDYSIEGYDRFLEAFLDHLALERVNLVVHDWGTVGLAFAQRRPARIARIVVIDGVPLLPGYRWHRVARMWRRPVVGELVMGATTRMAMRRGMGAAIATPGGVPGDFFDDVWAHFDQGTQRAILRLYRSAPEEVLAAAGVRLGEIGSPALVVWGERDPYIPARFADAWAQALGGETHRLPDAGHWPWLDRPDVVDRVVAFLSEG